MHASVVKQKIMAVDVRFRRLERSSTPAHFRAALTQLRAWLLTDPFFGAFVKKHSIAKMARLDSLTEHIKRYQQNAMTHGLPLPQTFDDQLATALAALDAVAGSKAPSIPKLMAPPDESFGPLLQACMILGHVTRDGKTSKEMIDIIKASVLDLRDFLVEYINLNATALTLIHRYKYCTEFFRVSTARSMVSATTSSKERALAFDLYAYLHGQGLDFSVEPSSASGEPDLVAIFEGGHKLIVDAKYIHDEGEAKRALVKGFRQVLDYCLNHNTPSGFLVVYLDLDIRINLKSDDDLGGMRIGDNVVYFCFVDIFDHSTTASKRPKPRVIDISHDDLVAAPSGGAQFIPSTK